ncbi:hypothetical protein L6452_17833 [Arctium lappa]|uniref:Uncharacterized protein n=1 Tax=Arctium lappa TaxID=4217 RepID=A0ACB9C4C0_ARCLA|nr:hypothetical protein L6452_17833 [Arctium lappa]
MMNDPLLRMRAIDAKTQYDIFRKHLSEGARIHGSIMKMKDIDLNAMMKEVERFNSMESDIKAQILLQASEIHFEHLI